MFASAFTTVLNETDYQISHQKCASFLSWVGNTSNLNI